MKKAQIQFMEMIFVLLILVVIIFIGMFLYFTFSAKSIQEKGEELLNIDAAILTDSIIGLPEITCGSNCVDTMKIIKFDSTKNPEYYNSRNNGKFRGMNIRIKRIFPVPGPGAEEVECDMDAFYEVNVPVPYPDNCGYFVVNERSAEDRQSTEVIQNAVALYYPSTGKYGFGLIRIEVFK